MIYTIKKMGIEIEGSLMTNEFSGSGDSHPAKRGSFPSRNRPASFTGTPKFDDFTKSDGPGNEISQCNPASALRTPETQFELHRHFAGSSGDTSAPRAGLEPAT